MENGITRQRYTTLLMLLSDALSGNGITVSPKSQVEHDAGNCRTITVSDSSKIICVITVDIEAYQISSLLDGWETYTSYNGVIKNGAFLYFVDTWLR